MVRSKRVGLLCVALMALVVLLAIAGEDAVQAAGDSLTVVTFNILAPCWASPSYYPEESWPFLPRDIRRTRILEVLKSQSGADIIALQEVNEPEFLFLKNALDKDYYAANTFHSPTYWSNWITVTPPWEPNGNALFLKRKSFRNVSFQDLALSTNGNHAVYAEALQAGTNRRIRVASIHLDSDYPYNREAELQGLLDLLPAAKNATDIIAGDFNIDITKTSLQNNLKLAGFQSLLPALGITTTTSPFGTYNKSSAYGPIDHITLRNAAPVSGAVIDFGLLAAYPDQKDDVTRIVLNMQQSGSDHFPVTVILAPAGF